ncbi:Putative ribonuclease H protein At1g65750 [Linum perenne]
MRAELRGAEIGLAYAWILGFKKIILHMDSLAAVNAILGPPSDDLRHVYREANQVADLLAHLDHSKPLGTIYFASAPPVIRLALYSDCIGTTLPRLIRSN